MTFPIIHLHLTSKLARAMHIPINICTYSNTVKTLKFKLFMEQHSYLIQVEGNIYNYQSYTYTFFLTRHIQ